MKRLLIMLVIINCFTWNIFAAEKRVGRKTTFPKVNGLNLEFNRVYYAINRLRDNVDNLLYVTKLRDTDNDTLVQVEESSDEDKIRFDTGGTQRAVLDSTGLALGASGSSLNVIVYDIAWTTQSYTIRVNSGTLEAIAN